MQRKRRLLQVLVLTACLTRIACAVADLQPTDIGGCHLWFDAGTLASLTNGAAVTSWVDRATGYNAASTNPATQPVYVSNALNGQPAVSFALAQQLLTAPLQAGWPTSNATLFVVCQADSTTQQGFMFSTLPAVNVNRFQVHLPWSGLAYFDVGDFAAGGRVQAPWDGGTNFNIWTLSSQAGVRQRILRNGALKAEDTTTGIFTPTGQVVRLGAVNGDLAELAIYPRVLSYPECNALLWSLGRKYGLATAAVDPTSADVALSAAVRPHVASLGETVSFTVTVTNRGPAQAAGVTVSNALPPEVSYQSHAGGAYDTHTRTWTIGDLAYAASTSLTLTVRLDAGALGAAVAWRGAVAGATADPAPTNNAATAACTVWYAPLEPGDFAHRMTFTLAGYTRPATLTDFPVLIKLDRGLRQFRYEDMASPQGWDLRFTDAGGTRLLAHEIDSWNTNGVSAVWVRVLELTNRCEIVAHWGNPSLAAAPPPSATDGAVWSAGHALVWHLEEGGAAQRRDATANGLHSSGVSNAPPAAAGIVGQANAFDETERHVRRDYAAALNTVPFTVSLWVKSADPTSNRTVLSNRQTSGGTRGYDLEEGAGNNWAFRYGAAPATTWPYVNPGAVRFGQWDHVLAAYDGARLRTYVNGVEGPGVDVAIPPNTAAPLVVGSFGAGSPFRGLVDEVRIESVARSADWVWAACRNVGRYDDFVAAETAIRSERASGVTAQAAQLNGTLLWDEGEATEVTVYWGATDGGASTGAWAVSSALGPRAPGPVSAAVAGLAADATYFYRFACRNAHGTAWSGETRAFRTLFEGVTNGLVLWLTAETFSNLADGSAVSRWEDASGPGRELVAFRTPPTYRAGALNGRPVLQFNGASPLNAVDGACGFTGSPALTVFVVARGAGTGIMRALHLGERAGADGKTIAFSLDASVRYNNGNRLFDASFNGAYAVGMWTRAAGAPYNGVTFHRSGRRIGEVSATLPAGTLSMADHRTVVGGGASNTGGMNDPLSGELAEILVYNRVLSVAEADAVGRRLGAHYGLATAYGCAPLNPAAFAHRLPIVVRGYDRTEPLTNFPVLVRLGEAIPGVAFETFASWQGRDLRFADADGVTPLDFEIEQWGIVPPIAWYAFESNALDTSVMGRGYHGELRGAARYSTNTVTGTGFSLSLNDDTSDYVLFNTFQGVTGRVPRTVSAWIRVVENNDTILMWGPNVAGQKYGLRVNTQTTGGAVQGALRIEVNGGYTIGRTLLTDGAWHHVAAVFPEGGDNALDVELYVDGRLEAVSTNATAAIDTRPQAMWVGRDHAGNYLTGDLDDLAIWDVALTSTQIARLYSGRRPPGLRRGVEYGEAAVWVRLPRLAPNGRFFAYWGSAEAAAEERFRRGPGAWSTDYEMVWHMRERHARDACAMGRDGTATGGAAGWGLVADAQAFNGAARVQHLITGNLTLPAFLVSAWAKADAATLTQWSSVFNSGDTGSDFQIDVDNGTPRSYRLNSDAGSALFGPVAYVATNWVHLAAACDGGVTRLYYNGAPGNAVAGAPNVFSRLDVGTNRNNDNPYRGLIDEVRVRRGAPSANWVWAEYRTVADPGFLAFVTKPEGMLLIVR